ncbi:response regulator transcription factor [Variovorax sp. Sphag1AA]|uniref:response regulator n=1 Tax=Variovorax sp. Sphag1AA TaxID=2587027 RepID=UPI00160DF961|nr:response regulator transcription factor [Variovorax sp. Sphag1AA]MBB3178359.1 DNA-binding NarL/FixJ family response regulator [Variovorax sp. Sphag1AA]
MRALWIEDHQLVGDSFELLLQLIMPDASLDKARDLDSARRLMETFPYELVLLDWWLGTHDGERSIKMLRDAGRDTPIIVVSGDDRDVVMDRALALGASGYVPKSADPGALLEAVRVALQGGVSRPPRQNSKPVDGAPGGIAQPVDVEILYPDLTPRQAEVFRALMRGSSDKQIARELDISDTTVKTHVRAILQIVGVHKRGEAAHEARVRGAGDL